MGDELLGFPEEGLLTRRLEVSVVEKMWHTGADAARIVTLHSEIVASLDHRFLSGVAPRWQRPSSMTLLQSALRYIPHGPMWPTNDDYRCGYLAGATEGDGTFRISDTKQSYWRVAVTASQREFLDRLRRYLAELGIVELDVKPFDSGTGSDMIKVETRARQPLEAIRAAVAERASLDYMRGWLAGMFDAEGSSGSYRRHKNIRPNSLRIANTVERRLQKIVRYGQTLGFDFRVEKYRRHTHTARLYGSASDRGQFFGVVRPALQAKTDACLGSGIDWTRSPVMALEALGPHDLICIQTSTGTFFANGFATHNCYAEALANRRG